MSTHPDFGFTQVFRAGPIEYAYLYSWDRPVYRRFDAWRFDGGVTLRYRFRLLQLRWR